MTRPLEILSCGAGVQSSTLYLMSLYGDIPPFDHVIFSDTDWEPVAVYEHLEKLKAEGAKYGSTITTVTAGNIREDHINPQHEHLFIRKAVKRPEFQGRQRTFIPFFVINPPGHKNKHGKTFRTCTKTYKIEPVEKEVRRILGLKPNQRWPLKHRVNQSMGISLDEVQRMRESDRPAIVNQYPLIDMSMTRDDCHEWLAGHGWEAPRSACVGCPFHRNDEWRRLRDEDPDAWQEAIEFDEKFRELTAAGRTPIEGVPYIHDQRVPLREANIDHDIQVIGPREVTQEEADEVLVRLDRINNPTLFDTMFAEHCEGFCGT